MQIQAEKEAEKAVALLAEGVDRNIAAQKSFGSQLIVALLAEGVDRNV